MKRIELSESEKRSPGWKKVRAYIRAQRDHLRRHNDNILPIEEKYALAGGIKELNNLLKLDPFEDDTASEEASE